MTRKLLALTIAAAAGCGGPTVASFGPTKVEIPVSDGARAVSTAGAESSRQGPPPSAASKESPFPPIAHAKLANGMGIDVVTSHALPIVQIRVLVRAGSGFGATPGVATLTGDMLKDGGTRSMSSADLLRRVETLGSDLSVKTDFDSTIVSMAVTTDQLGEGLSLLSQVVREPRFDGDELRKLKARTVDEAEDAARSSGSWTATRVVFHELFPEKSAYGTYGLVPSEIAKVDGAAVREFHRRFYVPKATTLVLAGDVDEGAAKSLAERNFGSWTGGEPPKVDLAPPRAPSKTRVIVAHRAKSVQSDVYIAMIAPPRKLEGWAPVRVSNQVLGGGVASRLFADVREQRSLAYRTSAQVMELAHGEQPLVIYAGTETGKTSQAVVGLLENLTRMISSPPTSGETESARRYISDVFAIRMETIGSIADMVVTQESFGLPDGWWDAYRKQVRATQPAEAAAAAAKLYKVDTALIVVAGDADMIASDLARFGPVTVVDPEKEFKTMRTLPQLGQASEMSAPRRGPPPAARSKRGEGGEDATPTKKRAGGARRTRPKARVTKKTGDVRSKPDTRDDGSPKKPAPAGPLKGSGIRYLRGLGHHLSPVVQIGKEGITDALVAATRVALTTHELIKVKVGTECPVDRKDAGPELATKTGATLAQILGRTLLLYKRHPSKPKIEIP